MLVTAHIARWLFYRFTNSFYFSRSTLCKLSLYATLGENQHTRGSCHKCVKGWARHSLLGQPGGSWRHCWEYAPGWDLSLVLTVVPVRHSTVRMRMIA